MVVSQALPLLLNPVFRLQEHEIEHLTSKQLIRLGGFAYFLCIGGDSWEYEDIEKPTMREIRMLLKNAAQRPHTLNLRYELLYPANDKIDVIYANGILLAQPHEKEQMHHIQSTAIRLYWPESTSEQFAQLLLEYHVIDSYLIPERSDIPVKFPYTRYGIVLKS